MYDTDIHTHSTFCDGKNTPEEMVLAAIDKGLSRYGISAHAHTPYESLYCMKKERYPEFLAEMARLKEKYSDRIELLCGIEQDYTSDMSTEGFDYVIGSVHYLVADGEPFVVDLTPELLTDACSRHFGGDIYALARFYYDTVADVVEKTDCDIIGHIDLITKFNEGGRLFDESDPRYVAAYRSAVDRLLEYGRPFEINCGAISRGYRLTPYPSRQIAEYIVSRGGRLIMSSDAHSAESIAFQYDKWESAYSDLLYGRRPQISCGTADKRNKNLAFLYGLL